jgi:DNA modification methylase
MSKRKVRAGDAAPDLKIEYVALSALRHPEVNPRKWTPEATAQLKESIKRYGVVDPLIVNRAPGREGVILGGNFRASVLRGMGVAEVPVVYIEIADPARERELIVRLNKNTGEFDLDVLKSFDESLLADIGFTSEELDEVFPAEETPETFDLAKELRKLDIQSVEAKPGDTYELGGSRLYVGDSTKEEDMLALCAGEKVDMCFTDPPYILDYLRGKKKAGKPTGGFGLKRDRHYIGTESLPPDFTAQWMGNVAKVAKDDFSIIVYENWKNVREIWNEMEKRWKVRNLIVWHLPNRVQGFSASHKLFNKHDIALVGTGPAHGGLNLAAEPDELLQNEHETALMAIGGKPHWEKYGKGKACPTDFIEFRAEDEAHSGQGVVFGTKPVEILIPYIKVLTARGGTILEPFGGSGSTLIAATRMQRRCLVMEKCPAYAEVIKRRWEKLTGKTAKCRAAR